MKNVLEYLEAAYLKAPEKTAYASETDSLTFRQVYMQARSVGTVLLKDGREAAIVEILDDTHFLVDVGDSPADWDTIDATIDDIVKVIHRMED